MNRNMTNLDNTVGGIISIKNDESHRLITNVFQLFSGGNEASGIITQIPHDFFASLHLNFKIGEKGEYAVAQMFLSRNEATRQKGIDLFLTVLHEEKLEFLGLRSVPLNEGLLSEQASAKLPSILQAFVRKPKGLQSLDFERKLYLVRRIMEKRAKDLSMFYLCSFSSLTMVYKALIGKNDLLNFYLDLRDVAFKTAVVFGWGSNSASSWKELLPGRYGIPTGDFDFAKNALNFRVKEVLFKDSALEKRLGLALPVINYNGLLGYDNAVEFLCQAGLDLEESILLLNKKDGPFENEDIKKFYEFNETIMEYYEGIGAFLFTNGQKAGFYGTNYNDLTYYVTKDEYLYLSSALSFEIAEDNIKEKKHLSFGQMVSVDLLKGFLFQTKDIEKAYSQAEPYCKHLDYLTELDSIDDSDFQEPLSLDSQAIEEIFQYPSGLLKSILKDYKVIDKTFYGYFKPKYVFPYLDGRIDSVHYLGCKDNPLCPDEEHLKVIKISNPLLTNEDLFRVKKLSQMNYGIKVIDSLFEDSIEDALDSILNQILKAILNGNDIIILSDRAFDEQNKAIPALLLGSFLNQELVRLNKRALVSLVFETAEPCLPLHCAMMLAFGADAVNPYGAFLMADEWHKKGYYDGDYYSYLKAEVEKIVLKSGMRHISSYIGSRLFYSWGLNQTFLDIYFKNMISPLGGIGLKALEDYCVKRSPYISNLLEEKQPLIYWLQKGCKEENYLAYQQYCQIVNNPRYSLIIEDELSVLDVKENFDGRFVLDDFKDLSYEAKRVLVDINEELGDRGEEILLSSIVSIDDLRCQIEILKRQKKIVSVRIINDDSADIAIIASQMGADVITIIEDESLYRLATVHQALINANLRQQVKIRVGIPYFTGKMAILAFMLGAEEILLTESLKIALGCMLIGSCASCPLGITGEGYKGDSKWVENYLAFLKKDMTDLLASLGYHNILEVIGDTSRISANVSFDSILKNPLVMNKTQVSFVKGKEWDFSSTIDEKILLGLADKIVSGGNQVSLDIEVTDHDHYLGYQFSQRIKDHFGADGIVDDTICLRFRGHAGFALGTHLAKGVMMVLEGDALGFAGSYLDGGNLIIRLSMKNYCAPDKNAIAGSYVLKNALSGRAFIDGICNDYVAYGNQGVNAVILGCGDYGCSYMAGGCLVVLGAIGCHFGYQMKGGVAFVYDEYNTVKGCLDDSVCAKPIESKEFKLIMDMVDDLIRYTDSRRGKAIMRFFQPQKFVKVVPR